MSRDKTAPTEGKQVAPVRGEEASVVEHALATGNARPAQRSVRMGGVGSVMLQRLNEDGRRVVYLPSAEHAAAAQLHGWNLHDVSDPPRMSLLDYESAIKAAAGPSKGSRRLKPHAKALSPYHPSRKEAS